MVNTTLISRIQKVLADKELSTYEIMELLKKENDARKNSSKRVTSFTSNQIAQLEKCGWHKKHNSNLWRNKNVMDRKIQTK